MEIVNDASNLLANAEQTLNTASKAALEQKEPIVRIARDLILAERQNELGVELARTADEISQEILDLVQFEDRDRGRAFDIKV